MLLLPGWPSSESRSCWTRRRLARRPLSRPAGISSGLGRRGARRPPHPGPGGPGNSRTPAGCRRSCRTAPRHLPHSSLSGRCATGSRQVTAEEERRQGAATGLFRPRRSTPGWGFPSSPACSFWMACSGCTGDPILPRRLISVQALATALSASPRPAPPPRPSPDPTTVSLAPYPVAPCISCLMPYT